MYSLTCGSWGAPSGITGMLFAGLVGSLLRGVCELNDPHQFPPDKWHVLIATSNCGEGMSFDYVIVGAGTAGSVLAKRLSEGPNFASVAVLEAGGNPPADSAVPHLFFDLQKKDVDWQFRTKPEKYACLGLKGRRSLWPRGKMLGGTSSMNSMLYIRGNRRDYDNWAAQGNLGWDYESVLPYFKKSEDILSPDLMESPYHGRGGPLPVSYFDDDMPLRKALMKATAESGYEYRDMNGELQTGFFRTQATILNNTRHSAARGFLGSLKNRKNLHVMKYSFVSKVIFENKQAVGVEFVRGDKRHFVRANKEVILCAGTINSPQLLMLSGIGPQEHLAQHGISTIYNSPGVGQNLQDHVASIAQAVSINPMQTNKDLNDISYQYFLHRKGPLSHLGTAGFISFICAQHTDCKYDDWPDVEVINLGPFDAKDLETFKRIFNFKNKTFNTFYSDVINKGREIYISSQILLRPKSVGKIELSDSNPFSKPKIYANYFSDQRDLDVLGEAAMWGLELIKSPSLQQYDPRLSENPLPGCAGFDMKSIEYWKCAISHATATTYHPSGTCKMGPNTDRMAVVDSKLRVYGVIGLRVVDASVMPQIVSGNLMAPVIMIAEKAADIIKERNWFSQ